MQYHTMVASEGIFDGENGGGSQNTPADDEDSIDSQASPSGPTSEAMELMPHQGEDGRWSVGCACVQKGTQIPVSFGRKAEANCHLRIPPHHLADVAQRTCKYGCGHVQTSARNHTMQRHWGTEKCRKWWEKQGFMEHWPSRRQESRKSGGRKLGGRKA